jgi:dTDP-4-dehydrorhamnose 3,5-epimerase
VQILLAGCRMMRFHRTSIEGVVEIVSQPHEDHRGSFRRTFCAREFAANGLSATLAQCSVSENRLKGTVRGFHLQIAPHEEAKLVQCIAGRLFDVALDLRPGSPTYGRFHASELSADSGRMLYIPEGCAHAFQCLEDRTSLLYSMSSSYEPSSSCGVRWNDPTIGVPWPITDAVVLSERDSALPTLAAFGASR